MTKQITERLGRLPIMRVSSGESIEVISTRGVVQAAIDTLNLAMKEVGASLDPNNENTRRGDLIAMIRDLRQIAQAATELNTTYEDRINKMQQAVTQSARGMRSLEKKLAEAQQEIIAAITTASELHFPDPTVHPVCAECQTPIEPQESVYLGKDTIKHSRCVQR